MMHRDERFYQTVSTLKCCMVMTMMDTKCLVYMYVTNLLVLCSNLFPLRSKVILYVTLFPSYRYCDSHTLRLCVIVGPNVLL